MPQIIIENLTKNYGKNLVFKNINLLLESKKIHFLVGENGSGKSTFIKCLLDMIDYEGEIRKFDMIFSYAPEKLILPDYLTVKHYLYLIGLNKNMIKKEIDKKVDYYINLFKINKYSKDYIYNLSKGTKQKIILIQALLGDSDAYIFDEPLSGLDDESRLVFIQEVNKLKLKEKMIIISTHNFNVFRCKAKHVIKFPLQGE